MVEIRGLGSGPRKDVRPTFPWDAEAKLFFQPQASKDEIARRRAHTKHHPHIHNPLISWPSPHVAVAEAVIEEEVRPEDEAGSAEIEAAEVEAEVGTR